MAVRNGPRKRSTNFHDGWTVNPNIFSYMCKQAPDRIGVVSEGDSWFAYPGDVRPWSLSNVIDHIVEHLVRRDIVNFLRLETNGATAKEMLSDKQKDLLESVLKKNKRYIRLILFSGGGNDILEKTTLWDILCDHADKFTKASDYVNHQELDKKLQEIDDAYSNLLDLCDKYVPSSKIVTHVYDVPMPRNKPYVVVPVALKKGPWIYPAVTGHKIPEKMHIPIARYLLKRLRECLTSISDGSDGKLLIADTQGTLRPDDENEWQDEIHPSSNGFRRIARVVYRRMMDAQLGLPEWRD